MKHLIYSILLALPLILFNSCEGCTKSATKKLTKVGLSAVEGVSEAINEYGEEGAEKAVDALGTLAKGAGKSIDRLLNEHAEEVAAVAGRTLVQTVEGLEGGLNEAYYDPISFEANTSSGISMDFFGKIKSSPVVDAYFITKDKNAYDCSFDFQDASGKSLMKKEAVIEKTYTEKKYSVVSFALNDTEIKALESTASVKVKVTKQ